MSLVIDASVALAWCFADEVSPVADATLERLVEEEALVPSIWPLEVANGLRTAERRVDWIWRTSQGSGSC